MRETQQSIAAWASETFGPAENLTIAKRAAEELAELIEDLEADSDDPLAAEEAADVVIVLQRLFENLGAVMSFELDRKMAINRKRKWKIRGDGCGDHVKENEHDNVKPTIQAHQDWCMCYPDCSAACAQCICGGTPEFLAPIGGDDA